MSKRAQNRAEQRERIVAAARLLFAERGFDDVTVSEIAAKCGVARATVFNHFRSKHALIDAMTAEVFEYYRASLERALAREDTPVPQLVRALFSVMGAGIERAQPFFQGAFREIVRLQVGLDEGVVVRDASQRAHELLVDLMARGQQRGELDTGQSALELARSFSALSSGTITAWLYEETPDSLQQRMERAAEVLLGGIGTAAAIAGAEPVPDLTAKQFPFDPPPTPTKRGPKT